MQYKEQIPKQQCQLCLVQTTLFRSGVDYESYNFYKSSCKILRYCIYRRNGSLRCGEVRGGAGRCGEVRGGAGSCGEVRGVWKICYIICML